MIDGPVMVEFLGGPRDGTVLQLQELRGQYLVPIPVGVDWSSWTNDEIFPDAEIELHTIVYRLVLGELGRPLRDDQGVYRYQYEGIR